MKKAARTLFTLSVLILGFSLMSFVTEEEKKLVYVESTTHDFGAISESNGTVNATFVIHNDSENAVSLVSVSASCGCTTPVWSREPIAPGQTAKIEVSFNPKGRSGTINKRVTAKTDGGDTLVMHIKGTIGS